MNAARWQALLRAGIDEGLLDEAKCSIEQDARPWPVVLLTALGAWLAAIPLIGVVAITLGDALRDNAGLYVVGAMVLAATVVLLRGDRVPLFFEQVAVPGLLVGGCMLGFGLFRDLHAQGGALAVAVLCVVVAILIPRVWLRVPLGAAAATMLAIAGGPRDWFGHGERVSTEFWWAWHAVAALLGVAAIAQSRLGARGALARAAATTHALGAGGMLAVLVALSWWSGMAFLVGATVHVHDATSGAARVLSGEWPVLAGLSAALAAGASLWLAHRWPSLRKSWCAGVAIVLVVLAWTMPALGAVLTVLALCATAGRWRLAGAAGAAAAWIVSSFYYALEGPLATKALVLMGAGAALGALAWWASRAQAPMHAMGQSAHAGSATVRTRAGVALTLVAVLAVANIGIWQKEQVARSGQTIFVELAPRDPRSLMQGDFMRLDFRLPRELLPVLDPLDAAARPRVVARRDSHGVAVVQRIDDRSPIGPDELSIDLTFKDGRWLLVTDSWFFKEGEALRWAGARYGEIKVNGDGRAMLVGLRGARLEPL